MMIIVEILSSREPDERQETGDGPFQSAIIILRAEFILYRLIQLSVHYAQTSDNEDTSDNRQNI